ncbi:MAG: isopentenyl phosphate kinase family protein, partial [Candidatus Aenigmarchaeota archaeon]|nr:isopentenyl phosphate kinase family protein [Candidatus Aenigmarchaeota archaeon]
MNEIIMLKLGGSLITDKTKPYTVNTEAIKRIAKEIREAVNEKDIKLIIGHGGGSFPHQSAIKYQTNKGLVNKDSIKGMAIVQNDAAKLNRIVVNALISKGINAVSIQPSAGAICESKRITGWDTKALEIFLGHNIVPVPYGDIGIDKKQGCCIISTEEILTFLAKKLGTKRIILAGKTDGVITTDGDLIPEITENNFNEIKKHLKGSDGADATGGMVHKVERMLEFVKIGINSEIINGNKKDHIKRALLGEVGLGT